MDIHTMYALGIIIVVGGSLAMASDSTLNKWIDSLTRRDG